MSTNFAHTPLLHLSSPDNTSTWGISAAVDELAPGFALIRLATKWSGVARAARWRYRVSRPKIPDIICLVSYYLASAADEMSSAYSLDVL